MKKAGELILQTDIARQQDLENLVRDCATTLGVDVEIRKTPRKVLRQFDVATEATVALAINIVAHVTAPAIIALAATLSTKLRNRKHNLLVTVPAAEAIAKDVVLRYSGGRRGANVISVTRLGTRGGYTLVVRQSEHTYTVKLNKCGQLESCIRR